MGDGKKLEFTEIPALSCICYVTGSLVFAAEIAALGHRRAQGGDFVGIRMTPEI